MGRLQLTTIALAMRLLAVPGMLANSVTPSFVPPVLDLGLRVGAATPNN
jgi:hypothetical protein